LCRVRSRPRRSGRRRFPFGAKADGYVQGAVRRPRRRKETLRGEPPGPLVQPLTVAPSRRDVRLTRCSAARLVNPAWLGFRRGSPTGPSSWRRSSEPPVRPARAGSWTNLLFLRAGTREPFSSSSRATGPKELARYEELYRRRAYLGRQRRSRSGPRARRSQNDTGAGI